MTPLKKIFQLMGRPRAGKLNFIKQQQPGGDGLACLSMIFAWYGVPITLQDLQHTYPNFCHGMGLRHLMDVATNAGLKANPWQCGTADLHKLKMPLILHWDMREFVLLAKASDNTFTVYHPAFTKKNYTSTEFDHHYGEIALEITSVI